MENDNQYLHFSQAVENDNISLTSLTKWSKAYWGFSDEIMRRWEQELTISAEYIRNNTVIKAHLKSSLVGYYSYIEQKDNIIELDNLFIVPNQIGKGLGRKIMNDFFDRVNILNPTKIILYSEPKAQMFYEKFGFTVVDQRPSAINNRTLPVMEKTWKP